MFIRSKIDSINLINAAASLISEQGENHEYDKGITELVCDALGITTDYKDDVLGFLRAVAGTNLHESPEPAANVWGNPNVSVAEWWSVQSEQRDDAPVTVRLDSLRPYDRFRLDDGPDEWEVHPDQPVSGVRIKHLQTGRILTEAGARLVHL